LARFEHDIAIRATRVIITEFTFIGCSLKLLLTVGNMA
jgi:hypothetical protein